LCVAYPVVVPCPLWLLQQVGWAGRWACCPGVGEPLAIVWHGSRPLTALVLLSVLFGGEALPAVAAATGWIGRPVGALPVCSRCAQACELLPPGGVGVRRCTVRVALVPVSPWPSSGTAHVR
jgi:hypothetical protein